MSEFFSRLNYSFGNEDWKTEQKALRVRPSDRVLCITASGDRPLNILFEDCKELVTIDANPLQNHLLSLKMAAMKRLDYKEYLAFLGANVGKNRKGTLKLLSSAMDQQAAQYWSHHEKHIEAGVLYEGAVEKITKKTAAFVRMMRPRKVEKLFSMRILKDQQHFLYNEWDSYFWKKAFDLGMNPIFTRLFVKDPGLFAHVPSSLPIGAYFYQRLHACLERHLACESSLVSLLLLGKVNKEAYPPYLTEEGVRTIRKRLNRISIKTADLISYLESVPENSFDVFSLSDVASYISEDDYLRLIRGVYRAAKPGARFSIRQFLSFRHLPENLESFFIRDNQLEQQLEEEDRCFVYRFMVGTISK